MRKNVRRATVVLALSPLAVVPTTAAFAALGGGTATATSTTTNTVTTTPAPPGSASGVAAQVAGILTVGGTSAHAGSGSATASADSVDLLGQQIEGGSSSGNASHNGSILDTGATPVGQAQVAPWSAASKAGTDASEAHAEAALAHADIAGAAELWILHSQSDATWNGSQSTGDSSSDGAEVNVGGQLDVKVLHSEAHSTGKSSSALLVLNGTGVVTSDDANGQCQVDASPLIDLLCLTASGGVDKVTGATTSTADVLTADVGGGALTGTVVGASTGGGKAAPAAQPNARRHHHRAQQSEAGPLPHTTGTVGRSLPFTGADIVRMIALAIATAAIGAVLSAFGRLRRAAALG